MRTLVRYSAISRLSGAVAAIWLCGSGSAWAGTGGGDAGSMQNTLDGICSLLGMTTCPLLSPNLTELVLELAGLENNPPEMVRAQNAIAPTAAVNAVNPPAGSPFALSNVAPLAFISPSLSGGKVSVTQPGDALANSFFYAATDGSAIPPGIQPTRLYLLYDYTSLKQQTFTKGQFIADIQIPLTVLNSNGTETSVPTVLQFRGSTGLPGYTVVAAGKFPGGGPPTHDPTELGLNATLVFGSSSNSNTSHAMFGIQVPLLVTGTTDPAYFSNPISQALPAIFVTDQRGFTAKFLKPPAGLPIGMAPVVALFTASILNNNGATVPAVNAYGALATDGEMLLSAPLP
jgi:hypothetical protein